MMLRGYEMAAWMIGVVALPIVICCLLVGWMYEDFYKLRRDVEDLRRRVTRLRKS